MTVFFIIISILIFGLLISVHETGHFLTAKLFNVRVEEFSIGMGPAIIKKQKGETLYALRCIPFGGYCSMTGEDEESDDERAFINQSPLRKLIILIAGSFMNFLLGLLIVIILYSDAAAFRAPVIADFIENCPYASEYGFQQGDRLYSIDGHRIYEYYDVSDFLSEGSGVYDIVLIRNGSKVKLNQYELIPVEYEGYTSKMYGFMFGAEEANFKTVVSHSWNTTMEFGRWVWMGISELFSGSANVEDMSGVVGIVDMMAETGEQAETTSDGLYDIFYIGAFIAVNLAMMNMLPIPALDGGRIFLLIVTLIIEKITHKKMNPKYEAYINAAGMILLFALMGFLVFNDIRRIIIK